MFPFVAGLVAATIVSLLARRAGALSPSGATAATICGTLAVAAGWDWAALLIALFVTSTMLGRIQRRVRDTRLSGRVAKGGARDAMQVVANGGAFVIASAGYWLHPHVLWQMLGAGGLAASTSDTWATEIGTLARAEPRSILNGRRVVAGTSGGITLQGSLAALAGAAFIAALAIALRWPMRAAAAAFVGGVLGCVVDSLLGASVQVRRWCPACASATEQDVHRCGTPTHVTGGWRWLNNDVVNVISSACGAAAGAWLA